MKRRNVVLGSVVLLALTGCASKDYVRSQTDPLAQRLDRLEAAQKSGALSDADRAAIKDANAKAQQALDAVSGLNTEVAGAKQDAARAQEAAQEAQKAAKQAQSAASAAATMEKKSEKIFKLEQKK